MMSNSRILVVDDDRSLLTALRSALHLRMKGIEVDTVDSGDEALQQLENSDYDIVITDIKMPGMDGLTLLHKIREFDPHLPTLLITGHGEHDLAVQALRGGAFDFIQKPIDRDYLVAALARAIQVRQLQRKTVSQQHQLERHAADLERAVEDRTRELQELNQTKDQFLAMLAHELRNPLACIRYAVDILGVSHGEDVEEELLDVMSRQVTHMTHLLDDLLDVSRIAQNKITLHKSTVSLATVVKEAADAMQPVIEEFDHTLAVALPDEDIVVDGDKSRLEQILVNLLHNAAKYTDPGGQISVSLERQDSQAVIAVSDNGIGISHEMLQRVFSLFSQIDSSLDRARGGLGIGLTLVQKLVQLHGGKVEAASEGEGQGSTFTVRLPITTSASDLATQHKRISPNVNRFRVLVVEDNSNLAKLTSELLRKCGQDVVAIASDGPAAIDAACTHNPDVAFLDIGIPQLDGYEVARRLRQIDELKDLKLIALTGYGQDEDRRKSIAAGFDRHITKPVSLQVLNELFATLIKADPQDLPIGQPENSSER